MYVGGAGDTSVSSLVWEARLGVAEQEVRMLMKELEAAREDNAVVRYVCR